ncbi:uncharacterized protein LOC142346112 [Convolutriloba macropyga]|uniref:uncharacterized protein LOC142346112 n=1 Tax=Convolutriloba macropyga TaxID=536237 RepID=UPI003F527738
MVFLQTVNDFVFSGLFGSAYYIYKLRSSSMRSCSGVFHEYAERFQQEAGIPNLKQDYLSTHETGCQPKWASLFDPGKDKLHLESFERSLRKIMEVFPFYSQCFLTLGLSWERWVKVCRPHDAKTLLDRQTQFGLTAIVLLLSVILPAIIFIDYELNKSEERFFCQNCIVNTFIYGELTLEISCFSVCFGLSGYFYYQVGRTLKTGLGVELADGGLADNQKMRFQPYCKPIVTDQ